MNASQGLRIANAFPATGRSEETIDPSATLATIWRGRWLVVLGGLVGLAAGYAVVSGSDPEYRATAMVLIDPPGIGILDRATPASIAASGDLLQTELEILRSTNLLGRVVDSLAASSAGTPAEGHRGTTSLRSASDLSGALAPHEAESPDRVTWLADLDRMRHGLAATTIRNSRVIAITFRAAEAEASAAAANAIAEQYIVDRMETKLAAARSSTAWLNDRVAELRQSVREAEDAVEAARAGLLAESGQSIEITRQQLTSLNNALALSRQDASVKEALHERLLSAVRDGDDLGALSEFRNSPIIGELRRQESDLLGQLAALRAGHPVRERLEAQIEDIRQNIREEAARIAQAIDSDLQAVRTTEQALAEQIRALEDMAAAQSRGAVEIRQLEREAEASRNLYEHLLARLQESMARESLHAPDARIISPAEVPLRPDTAAARRNLALSVLAGLLAASAILLARERWNDRVRSASDLERMTGLPVIATIPCATRRAARTGALPDLRMLTDAPVLEGVRNLRTFLLNAPAVPAGQIVMFTSAEPMEGKSSTALLMALTCRQLGKSAILVDCDLRRSHVLQRLNADYSGPGLISALSDEATTEAAIFRDPATGLHVLAAVPSERPAEINPADLLASQAFRDLLQDLSSRYDLILLDTPPTLAVTDARILSVLADSVIFTVRWNRTTRNAVLQGLRELTSVDANVVGLVLTMLDSRGSLFDGSTGFAARQRRYRQYYEIDPEPRRRGART